MSVTVPTKGESEHRGRLLGAMAELVAERGYPAVTVGDVVGRARVSKRTFYEYFADREACFLSTYAAAAEGALDQIATAAEESAAADLPMPEMVRRGVRAYLTALAAQPGLTRTLLTEISSVGPRGWEVRREVLRRFADQLAARVAEARASMGPADPRPPSLTSALALALVGGINELVLEAVETGRADRLPELESTATELVVAVLGRAELL